MKKLVGIISIAMVILVSTSTSDPLPPCNDILSSVSPCIPYLSKSMASPSKSFCDGWKYLDNYSSNKANRVSICKCLQGAASTVPNADFSLLPSLTTSCGVHITLPPITSGFNCSNLQGLDW